MPVIITVNEYLDKIKWEESKKPPAQRRSIPTKPEFAEAAEVSRQAFYKWLKEPSMSDVYFDAIITKMRANGFDTDIGDLVKYEPPTGSS